MKKTGTGNRTSSGKRMTVDTLTLRSFGPVTPIPWNPSGKEPWHIQFENEFVNDERWYCTVTAGVPVEVKDEEYLEIFNECAAAGLRKAIRVITIKDVIKLLKVENKPKTDEKKSDHSDKLSKKQKKSSTPDKPDKKQKKVNAGKSEKKQEMQENPDKIEVPEKKRLKPPPPRVNEIIYLARQYVRFENDDCSLPPDLMAGVIKYLILNLKDQQIFEKKFEAAVEKKRKHNIVKDKFIRDMKPFRVGKEKPVKRKKVLPDNLLGIKEAIEDEPFGGPDLYIMLSGFLDPDCFPELLRINVPIVALLKITDLRDPTPVRKFSTTSLKTRPVEFFTKKPAKYTEFWKKLKESCLTVQTTLKFKDIAMMHYQVPTPKMTETKQSYQKLIFDELSWVQYSAFCIYRQHQNYLQEMFVQRVILSMDRLDLSKCLIYNKLCDLLVVGDAITIYLILFAMIEQVVVGVPFTESINFDYERKYGDFVLSDSDSGSITSSASNSNKKSYLLVTPCQDCREKGHVYAEEAIAQVPCSTDDFFADLKDWTERRDLIEEKMKAIKTYQPIQIFSNMTPSEKSKDTGSTLGENSISELLLNRIAKERKTEKDLRKEKQWKSPLLCFYGDKVTMNAFHCDPRIISANVITERFLKSVDVLRLWSKYPELPEEQRAFYGYHFFNLMKSCNENRNSLKLKIFFALVMKLVGIIKSYMYKGDDENISELLGGILKEKLKKLSKVRFEQGQFIPSMRDEKNFSNYFFKTFLVDVYLKVPRKSVQMDNVHERTRMSILKSESHNLRKVTSQFNMYIVTHRSSGNCFPYCFKQQSGPTASSSPSLSQADKEFTTFSSLMDCFDISNLTETQFVTDKNEYDNLVREYAFYENLESNVMIQRLLEAQDQYNTTQCTYFAPTDTLIVISHNDYDHRGIFFTYGSGALLTPVSLRDFYNYVYPEIGEWIVDEETEFAKFTMEVMVKNKEMESQRNEEYFNKLKKEFCDMNEEERLNFLNTDGENESDEESEITEQDLEPLPKKKKPDYLNKVSFVTTNFTDVRVETQRNIHEFHSKDGIEINVIKDSWLYDPRSLMTLIIKQLKFELYHYVWLDGEVNPNFHLKANNDVLFSFYKPNEPDEIFPGKIRLQTSNEDDYCVKASWPTGLVIEKMQNDYGSVYVRQRYLSPYKKGWDIEEEKYRCFLKNGQLLIFKENGNLEILSSSGIKYHVYEFSNGKSNSSAVPGKDVHDPTTGEFDKIVKPSLFSQYEMINSLGEVWRTSPCNGKFKFKYASSYKIFVAMDQNMQEIFYRRDDGTLFMLWPNGKLVTTYSDGTKITSMPDFEDIEVSTEWTDKEKSYFVELEAKHREEDFPRSRTILRKLNLSTISPRKISMTTQPKQFSVESFVSISCSYLFEHPKYSSVYFNSSNGIVDVRFPDSIYLSLHPDGQYVIRQDGHFIRVERASVSMCSTCKECEDESTATIYFESKDTYCRTTDFFRKVFTVTRDGQSFLEDSFQEDEEPEEPEDRETAESPRQVCSFHMMNDCKKQRCFALKRDLSGIEFLHANTLSYQCYDLPEDTYYELDVKEKSENSETCHIFSMPYKKLGPETWTMEYENQSDSVPTNLKKKNLKEQGIKENFKTYHKYSFNCPLVDEDNREPDRKMDMSKLVVTRIVRCLSADPKKLLDDLQKDILLYQKKARSICNEFKSHKVIGERSQDARYLKMRLKKIALTLNQTSDIYPHICSELPSTEKDIHYFGHFINLMETFHSHGIDEYDDLPSCKQIPKPLPRSKSFESILEENEDIL